MKLALRSFDKLRTGRLRTGYEANGSYEFEYLDYTRILCS